MPIIPKPGRHRQDQEFKDVLSFREFTVSLGYRRILQKKEKKNKNKNI